MSTGMVINHNLSALNTQRQLSSSGFGMNKAIEKLSSGYRINVGADDPSGLIISEQLRSQISGLERAVRNSSEAYNLIGIAEGALNEMNSILKKMRALAIHAANSGITSPEQVAADQAELDSGIETINRIANTTRYSDQYLLNGSKELVYDVTTTVNEPTDHALLDTKLTRVDEIFKRSGVRFSIGYTGERSAYQANTKNQAQRAYLEADNANPLCQINGGNITHSQQFILTGTKGSRLFSFSEGEPLGRIVEGINNVKDSTGIGATLTFASDVRIDKSLNGIPYGSTGPIYSPPTKASYITGYDGVGGNYVYRTGDIQIYGAGLNNAKTSAIACVCITPNAAAAFKVGYNCDGDGKIYAKVVNESTGALEYYKDKECTMLIGKGDGNYFSAANNSGIPSAPKQNLDGIFINLTDNAKNLDVFEIALVGQRMDNMKDFTVTGLSGWTDIGNSVMSGVNLAHNTSPEGEIFYRYTPLTFAADGCTVATFKVEVFSHSSMEPKYLVASSGEVTNAINANTAPAQLGGQTVRVESVVMANGKDSGLNITLNLPKSPYTATTAKGDMPKIEMSGSVSFTNLGIRLWSDEYGSAETIRIQNKEGELFYQYRESDTQEKVMIKSGTTVQVAGQDANITMNGAPIITQGLKANTTTPDFSGCLVFNGGSLGLTTLAVAGYEDGKLYSRATSLQGVKEDEIEIEENRRYFEPPSLTYAPAAGEIGLKDKMGTDVNIYLDFSQMDPTVEAKVITGLDAATALVNLKYDQATEMLTIDASALAGTTGTIKPFNIKVDPSRLAEGFYITDPNLKGVFIKSETLVSLPKSTTGAGMDMGTATFGGEKILEVGTYATNPRSNTSETMDNFVGGMQFQLGNTEGDQDRTVYSIQSMAMSNMGRINYNGIDYCLQDVLGGGPASLSRDPILAMYIIGQAVDDVSTLRARLGAFQSNMLQTNINSLNVAIENITKTESAIRDTDMASETTEFTRFQIMQQAGTSMLAQANQTKQNILSLLQ